jgi:hypothetical protein
MESNGNSKSGLLTAGGVLSIIAGVFQIVGGVIMVVIFLVPDIRGSMLADLFFLPFLPPVWSNFVYEFARLLSMGSVRVPISWMITGGIFVVLGIIALAGGISAIRRKRFGLSLAGAICSLPSVILGILAVVFVSVSKKEFP